jgi:predicted enzyme related to lactoylglutathione lyase
MAGEIVHIEIPADDDIAAQREFWGALFGWQFSSFPGSPSEYWMARIDDKSGVAISESEAGKKGMRTYFTVDDIKAGAARVRSSAATRGDPMRSSMGWFVTCTGPHERVRALADRPVGVDVARPAAPTS